MRQQADEQGGFAILDEPPQVAEADRHVRRRAEMLCGLLLLLAVVGWSLWSWREQQQRAAYDNGKRYAAGRDWDRALAAFRAAGPYADSAALIQQAQGTIAERGRLYSAAVDAASHDDWLAALQNVRLLRAVQPTYRDSSALYSLAENRVYRAALAGVVALRPAASPAGLYLRSDQTWIWLPSSDSASSVQGYGSGCLLYDVPTGRASMDGSAAVPNLFYTSVLSVDFPPETRGLMRIPIAGGVIGAAGVAANRPQDETSGAAGPTGRPVCAANLRRPADLAHQSHAGTGLLAYLAGGDLRVRTDDGKIDLLLEQGVQNLYYPTP